MRDESRIHSGEPLKALHLDRIKFKNRPKMYPADRWCPECGYRLCRLNPGPNCYRHTEPTYPKVRGKGLPN